MSILRGSGMLYRNGRVWRVRVVQISVWACALTCWWLTIAGSAANYDVMLTAVTSVLGSCAVAGMELYLRRYIVRLDASNGRITATTLTTAKNRRFDVARNLVSLTGSRLERFGAGRSS
jgi:hypothetical protein